MLKGSRTVLQLLFGFGLQGGIYTVYFLGFTLGKAKEANNRHQNDRIQTSSRGGRVLPLPCYTSGDPRGGTFYPTPGLTLCQLTQQDKPLRARERLCHLNSEVPPPSPPRSVGEGQGGPGFDAGCFSLQAATDASARRRQTGMAATTGGDRAVVYALLPMCLSTVT